MNSALIKLNIVMMFSGIVIAELSRLTLDTFGVWLYKPALIIACIQWILHIAYAYYKGIVYEDA